MNRLTKLGIIFITLAVCILILTFLPIVFEEIGYRAKQINPRLTQQEIIPVNTDFGIVIPKLTANSKIIMNVDPFDSRIYQRALTQGVAHARGTGLPGYPGNVFLFSHSSVNFYEAARYNSVFYLLNKLEFGDEIFLYYLGEKFTYTVTSTSLVGPKEVGYLKSMAQNKQTLTLMTCWPPGTTYKRLLVLAERKLTN